MSYDEIIEGYLPILIEQYKRGKNPKEITELVFKEADINAVADAINLVRDSREESDGPEKYFNLGPFMNDKAMIPGSNSKLITLHVYLVRKMHQMKYGKETVQTRILLLDELARYPHRFTNAEKMAELFGIIINITPSRITKALNPKAEEKAHGDRAEAILERFSKYLEDSAM